MMSVERSFEAWEEVQRHGQGFADRIAQGFIGLIQSHIAPPSFPWPNPPSSKLFEVDFPTQNFMKNDFGFSVDDSAINGVTAIFDIGNRIGQAGADFGAALNGTVQQIFRRFPVPFRHDENAGVSNVSVPKWPNGQVTYVSGEGLSTSAFLPLCGGLLQAQGRYPGEMKFGFSCKNKWGTRITPTWQWPDRSFALGLEQGLAWKRSGIMVRPAVQFSLRPTFGGSCPGVHMEVTHSVKDELNLSCGCALVTRPSAFASVGRSKWNGNVGNAGIVMKVEMPLNRLGRPWFSVQLNSGIEF